MTATCMRMAAIGSILEPTCLRCLRLEPKAGSLLFMMCAFVQFVGPLAGLASDLAFNYEASGGKYALKLQPFTHIKRRSTQSFANFQRFGGLALPNLGYSDRKRAENK